MSNKFTLIDWGPIDAAEGDPNFTRKWFEAEWVINAMRAKKWIITGEKGVGKSAIARAIKEIYQDKFSSICSINFNDQSFQNITNQLNELVGYTLSRTETLSNFWQYTLITELINASAKSYPNIYSAILREATEHNSAALVKSENRILTLFNNLTSLFDFKTNPQEVGLLSYTKNITAERYDFFKNYPMDEKFEKIRDEFFALVLNNNHTPIIILDGFDRLTIPNSRQDALTIIFSGLIDALREISTFKNFNPNIQFKALIPTDRLYSIGFRDADKSITKTYAVVWDEENLKNFLLKRIDTSITLDGIGFPHKWSQIMPATIKNTFYDIDEDSFKYILRHTLWRPRQLQIHLEKLSDNVANGKDISSEIITNAVVQSSKEIARFWILEFSTDYSYLGEFIGSLKGKSNIISIDDFKTLISNAVRKWEKIDINAEIINDKIDLFYSMGLFGVLKKLKVGTAAPVNCSPLYSKNTGVRYYVDFSFKRQDRSITKSIAKEDEFVFHPIFVDFIDLAPNEDYLIA